MSQSVLTLTNTNLFKVMSMRFLKGFNLIDLNVRYTNETLSKDEMFIQQIKELKLHHYFVNGMVESENRFVFNQQLAYRIETEISKKIPNLIIYEMHSFDEHEWLLLNYIQMNYKIPVVVFSKNILEKPDDKYVKSLKKIGVKETITELNESTFKNVVNRYL